MGFGTSGWEGTWPHGTPIPGQLPLKFGGEGHTSLGATPGVFSQKIGFGTFYSPGHLS